MKITLDGTEVEIFDAEKNLVEIAAHAGVGIPAPCWKAERKFGCCHACVVEIDGQHQYACGTKPKEGMDIVVNREDLKALRKKRLVAYKKNMSQSSRGCGCDCSSGKNSTSSGCC